MHVGDEDGGDVGEGIIHAVAIVTTQLAERPLTTVQQDGLTSTGGGGKRE